MIQQAFLQTTDLSVLLLAKSAGGIGLSLEAGSMCLYEPHFNYAKDAQTIGRVQRLGQTHTIAVHHLCMTDGMDMKLRAMQLKKVHESRRYNPDYKSIIDNVFPGEPYRELSDDDVDDDEDDDDDDEDEWRPWTLNMLYSDPTYVSGDDDDYTGEQRRRIPRKK
jgi:hypothetical protein